jgi:molybdopterin-guanine dinucleotide biosynthesis protein A
VAGLLDWAGLERAERLCQALMNQLMDNNAAGILSALESGLKRLAISNRVKVLASCEQPLIRAQVLAALTECYVQEPGSFEFVPAVRRRPVVERVVQLAESRDAEMARRSLSLIAEEGDDFSLALLERALQHEASRVRVHAHRLLRHVAPKERYLQRPDRRPALSEVIAAIESDLP